MSTESITTPGRPALRLVSETDGSDPLGRDHARWDDGMDDHGDDLADAEALAVESHCLRRRAEREAVALERGGLADRERVVAVVRAFKAYRPFVFERDRTLNDAAHRRLVAAYRAARSGRPDAASA